MPTGSDAIRQIENYLSRLAHYTTVERMRCLPVVIHRPATGVNLFIAREQGTGEMGNKFVEDSGTFQNSFNSNRQFIKLEQSFDQQLANLQEVFGEQIEYVLHEKMKLSADAILNCSPDKISLQLTREGGIFYTFLKGDTTVYFEHFLIDEYDDSDEAIVSVFKGAENVINYAGSLSDALTELNKALLPESINLELA